MEVLLISVVLLMRVLQSFFNKKVSVIMPSGVGPYISYITVLNFFSAVFALAVMIPTVNFGGINWYTVLFASLSGICLAINLICEIKSLTGGTMALYSMSSASGMIIPIVLGFVAFGEALSWVQIVSMCVLFFAIFLLVASTKDTFKNFSIKTVGWLIGAMVSNGMVMFCQKIFGELQPDGNVSMFSMLTFLVPAIVFGMILLFVKPAADKALLKEQGVVNERKSLPPSKKIVIFSAILAFAVFIIQQFVTILTPMMPAVVLFAIVNGGATVIAAVVGAVAFKEKLTVKSTVGIVLGVAALVLIKIFEI